MSEDGTPRDADESTGGPGGDAAPLPTWTPPSALPPAPPAWAPPSPAGPLPTGWAPPSPGPVPPPAPLPPGPSTWSPSPPVSPPALPPRPEGWNIPGGAPAWTAGPPTADGAPGPIPGGGATPPAAPSGWAPPAPGQAPASWGAPLPVYATSTAGPPPGPANAVKHRSRAALAILSVTAVLAASTFAFIALTRPDGAGSAEAAVEDLFAAVADEDAIGVMEALPPGEREVLLDPMVATVGELQRLGLLESFALEDVPGADIEVDGLTLQATNLGEGVTKVRVTGGTITGTVIPDEVPIGSRVRDLAERNGGDPIVIEADTDSESLAGIELVAIEEDGGWHVSLFYSIAEAIRGDTTPLPPFGAGITPIGADSPEGAVRGLVDAGLALDLGRAVGYLPPDEMRVLYDYTPLFVDDADAAAADARAGGYVATLDRLDLHSEGDGDTRRVTIDGLDLTVGADGGSAHLTDDGSCSVIDVSAVTDDGMFGNLSEEPGGFVEPLGDPTTTEQHVEVCRDGRTSMTVDGEVVDESDGFPPSFLLGGETGLTQAVTVVQHDGLWYVSPVRTMFDSLLTSLRGLQGEDIDRFFDAMDDVLGSGSGPFDPGGTIDEDGTFGTIVPPDPNDPYVICEAVYDDLYDQTDPTDEEWDAADAAFDQCLIDHGEVVEPDPPYVGDPQIAGGHILVPSEGKVIGYGLDGAPAFDGPACEDGSWVSTTAGSAPTVAVALCDGDELVGIEGTDGAELWRRPVDEDVVAAVGPNAVLVLDATDITVLDLATGAERWTDPSRTMGNFSMDEAAVYLDDGTTTTARDLATGAERWSVPLDLDMLDTVPGAVMVRTSDAVVHRLDPATGVAVWSSEPVSPAIEQMAVAGATADVVVLVSADGSDQAMAFDRETGALLWSRASVDSYFGAVVGGTTVVLSDYDSREMLVLDARTGEVRTDVAVPDDLWSHDVEGNLLVVEDLATDPPTLTTITLP